MHAYSNCELLMWSIHCSVGFDLKKCFVKKIKDDLFNSKYRSEFLSKCDDFPLESDAIWLE